MGLLHQLKFIKTMGELWASTANERLMTSGLSKP